MSESPLLWGPPQVIDPDDQGQMERFARLHDEAWRRVRDRNPGRAGTPNWEIVAEQFRLFKDPDYRAAPDEPTGLGSVVEDASGERWVRTTEAHLPWYKNDSSGDVWMDWYDIKVVRVLSEGVVE